jgi:hypothetical protein
MSTFLTPHTLRQAQDERNCGKKYLNSYHGIIVVLLMSTMAGADTIGDFAPLNVNNKWVYNFSIEDNRISHINYQEGTLTYSCKSRYESGDTLFYFFENRGQFIRGTKPGPASTSDSIFFDTYDTTLEVVDTVYYDTLIEVANSIRARSGMRPPFPVCDVHTITTEDTALVDLHIISLEYVDGEYELNVTPRVVMNAGGVATGYGYTLYKSNVGLIQFMRTTQDDVFHSVFSRKYTLQSFESEPVGVETSTRMMSVSKRNQQKTTFRKSMALPHLIVIRNGKTFNLLGREYRNNRNRTLRAPRQRHQCVVDLFQ